MEWYYSKYQACTMWHKWFDFNGTVSLLSSPVYSNKHNVHCYIQWLTSLDLANKPWMPQQAKNYKKKGFKVRPVSDTINTSQLLHQIVQGLYWGQFVLPLSVMDWAESTLSRLATEFRLSDTGLVEPRSRGPMGVRDLHELIGNGRGSGWRVWKVMLGLP